MRLHLKPAVVIAALILLGSGYYFFGLLIPSHRPAFAARNLAGGYGYGNDLYPVWLGSIELFHGRNPYAPELTPRIETGIYGRPLDRSNPADARLNLRAFAYPLYTAFLLAPLAALSFPAVQVVISIVLPALAALTVIFWLRTLDTDLSSSGIAAAVCIALASYPVMEGVNAGQPGLLTAALIAAAVASLTRERFILAGILLSSASLKPQLVLLVALWLILWGMSDWPRRKNFVISFAATTMLLLAASTWLMPSWFAEWMRVLREYRLISPPPLAQFVLGRYAGDLVSLFLLVMSAALCWRYRRENAGSEGFALVTVFTLAATAVVLPSTIAVYDQFLLLPAALWLYTHRHLVLSSSLPVRVLVLLTLGILSWQYLAACGLVFAAFISPAVAHTPALLLLPLRAAASAPFALVALMCIIAVRKIRRDADAPRLASPVGSAQEGF